MFNRIYQNFCFLVKRMCQIFVIYLKLFFLPLLPLCFLKFWGPLPLGVLRQLPNWPSGRTSPEERPMMLPQGKKKSEIRQRKVTNYSMLRTWCHIFKDVSRVSTKWGIIVYSWNTINTYSFFSHEW